MQFQDVIFYVVSDDPIWAKPYFETSAASDGKTFYVGGQQSVDGHFQEIGETDLVGKKHVLGENFMQSETTVRMKPDPTTYYDLLWSVTS